jgi:hypothetical protein
MNRQRRLREINVHGTDNFCASWRSKFRINELQGREWRDQFEPVMMPLPVVPK